LEFLNLIKEKNIETEVLIRGDELNFGDLRLVALWPERDLTGESVDDLNSTSIVLKLSSAEFQALLLADIDRESQQVMLNRGDFNDFSDIDLLKIAHHGSGENYNQNLIDKVRPKQAIISVGEDNRYGHPAKSVVDDLLRREIELFRTDRDGSVSFTTNGASLSR
jgi:competence protein ComEC